MDYKTRMIAKRVELALEDLNTAIGRIACSERTAHIFNEAADSIFMAKQFLEKNVKQNKRKNDKH